MSGQDAQHLANIGRMLDDIFYVFLVVGITIAGICGGWAALLWLRDRRRSESADIRGRDGSGLAGRGPALEARVAKLASGPRPPARLE